MLPIVKNITISRFLLSCLSLPYSWCYLQIMLPCQLGHWHPFITTQVFLKITDLCLLNR